MELKSAIIGVISVLIGVVLVTTVAVPSLDDAADDTDPTTVTQSNYVGNNTYNVFTDESVTATLTRNSAGTNTVSINGYDPGAMNDVAYWRYLLVSESFIIQQYSTDMGTYCYYILLLNGTSVINLAKEVSWTGTITVSTSGGTATLTDGTWSYTVPCTWLVAPVENGSWVQYEGTSGAIVPESWREGVILANIYFTNNIDYYYSYYNGEFSTTYSGGGSAEFAGSVVEGTTDILSGGMAVTLGDNTFDSASLFVLKDVPGHADHGAMHSLVEMIPLLLLMGLVLSAVAVFISRRQ